MTDITQMQPGGPQMAPQGPPQGMGPEPDPVQMEVEARDQLGAALAQAAQEFVKQARQVSTGDPAQAKDLCQAVLYLTESLVLVAPLESTGPVGGPGGAPVPLPPRHLPPQASVNVAEQQVTGRAA